MKKIFTLTLVIICTISVFSQTLTINITNIRKGKGQLLLGIYDSEKNYSDRKSLKDIVIDKSNITNGKTTVKVKDLKFGTYGIALLDDEDFNKKMTYGFFMPKEGFAFSDYYHTGMSRPVFSDFKFDFSNNEKIITMKLRYL